MALHYYDKLRCAANDLHVWLSDDARGGWSDFCRVILLRYGLTPRRMLRLLHEAYPRLTIVDDAPMNVPALPSVAPAQGVE